MFDSLPLQPIYSSNNCNIAQSFYVPVLKEAVRFDRASAYFSAKALAFYADGLEVFAEHGHLYRLIISSQVSESDFLEIEQGYTLKQELTDNFLDAMNEDLTLKETQNISNLAFLIAVGIVEIKIAFTAPGIFHDKFGIFEDEGGNFISFRGSNNETQAAIENNYESFDVTCSWLASSFDLQKIYTSQAAFDDLWNNRVERMVVLDIPSILKKSILKYNSGKLIIDKAFIVPNSIILDYESGVLKLHVQLDDASFFWNVFYKIKLKRYKGLIQDDVVSFPKALTYIDFQRIIQLLTSESHDKGYTFNITERLQSYIDERNIHIDSRARLGMEIKHQDPKLLSRFNEYSAIVDSHMVRKLRDKQMWDSFFMCFMDRAGNFSVPGSGKTASVLGVYAYLKSVQLIDKIVVVGPISSFKSWIDEFKACFGDKELLDCFNIQDPRYSNTSQRHKALKFDTGSKNLILINYESVGTYSDELSDIICSRTLLVFDEVHKVKAVDGIRAMQALEISKKALHTIVMTGTPIPNSYCDIYNFLNILFPDEYRDFFAFSIRTLRNPTPSDICEINRRIQPFFCRTTKQQLNVPAPNPDDVMTWPASDSEERMYHILCSALKKNKLALIIRLLQMESDPHMLLGKLDMSELGDVFEINDEMDDINIIDYSSEMQQLISQAGTSTKVEMCIIAIKELVSQGKAVVVWCIFRRSIDIISKRLTDLGISCDSIHGDVRFEDREQIIEKFKSGDFMVLITNPHTMAESVSLHSICHDAVYFEYSYNLVHMLQSKDRIHRLGLPQGQYTQYRFLQLEFHDAEKNEAVSLDQKIYNRLMEKERIMLEAIDSENLESVSTTQEDLDMIFNGLL